MTACRALRDADWLKGKLAYVSIIHRTDACPMEQIKLDNMQKPSAVKLKYYEGYYQKSHTLAHSIVVDEQGYLRDGYISYILACKYGIRPDIYEAFNGQPLKKIVRGRHILRNNDTWRIKSDKSYIWNYTLRNPVVPGDILKADTKNGPQFIPAGNEPSGHASMSIWRLPQGSNTPQLCCAASLMPRSLLRGI